MFFEGARLAMEKSKYSKEYYYFGHHKCATNWMRGVFQEICKIKQWDCIINGGQENNLIFPTKTACIFMNVNSTAESVKRMTPGAKGFHLIRDPRDALVSQYFSWKNSHKNNNQNILDTREKLLDMSTEDGLILMLDYLVMIKSVNNWELGKYPNVLEVKYEDLVNSEYAEFSKIINHLEIPIRNSELQKIVEHNSFEKKTKRSPGEEDKKSHLRKGVAGDWRNYFTDQIKNIFKERYGSELIRLNYEKDMDW